MSERYTVVPWSWLGHCCHTASVVDTLRPEDDEEGYVVCECLTDERARAIAAALNAAEASAEPDARPR